MKTSKILLGGLAGSVAFFTLGWLIYGVLLRDYMMNNQNQCAMKPMEDMVMWAMILSNLAGGFLFSIVFSWSNTTSLLAGVKVGGVIGLLFGISVDLGMYAMSNMFLSFSAVCVDICVYTFMAAVVGAIVALVMGLSKKETQ